MNRFIFLLLLPLLLAGSYPKKTEHFGAAMTKGFIANHQHTSFEIDYNHFLEGGSIFGMKLSIGATDTTTPESDYQDNDTIENLILKMGLFAGPTYRPSKNLRLITALTGGLTWIGKDDGNYHSHYNDREEVDPNWKTYAGDEFYINGGGLLRFDFFLDHNFVFFGGVEGGGALLFGQRHDDQRLTNLFFNGFIGLSILF